MALYQLREVIRRTLAVSGRREKTLICQDASHRRSVARHCYLAGFGVSAMNLDELQAEVEKLLALLKDRQPGLMTWNMFLNERLEAVQKMIESAGVSSR
ncbi:hypothetical protein Poly59_30040 [Rubripirellula reticaptiva]|uniref:Uncharacterized protein n=2 Tax=Rubripirellula reticaptiva TaxID=2528013 RepID=A0A5C6EQT8_9BACT|nr:hypothetical protein Poly59_30040 [Rubripirellula reticaptiva]